MWTQVNILLFFVIFSHFFYFIYLLVGKSYGRLIILNCTISSFIHLSIPCPWLFTRMFLVYNEETGRFQTGRHYPTMILVSLSAVDETKVKLEAVGMPSVIFDVPKCSKNDSEAVQCTMWWGEPVKCIDCGPEPAEWLSRFAITFTSLPLIEESIFEGSC